MKTAKPEAVLLNTEGSPIASERSVDYPRGCVQEAWGGTLAATVTPTGGGPATTDRTIRCRSRLGRVSALQRPVGPWDRPSAAGLLQLGEVVPEGLPLGLVRAVVVPGDGMTCRLGALTTAPTVRLLDLMPGSRSGLAPFSG